VAPVDFNPKAVKKQWKAQTPEILQKLLGILEEIPEWRAEEIKRRVSEWIEEEGLGFGKVLQPVRISLTGDLKGPDLFAMMELLGRDETLKRIRFALETVRK